MTNVVVTDLSSSNSLLFSSHMANDRTDSKMKRKTPSELRGEQLKRKSVDRSVQLLSSVHSSDGCNEVAQALKKCDMLRTAKYIDTRVDDIFPVRKSSDMFRVLPGKAKSKDIFSPREVATNGSYGPASACVRDKHEDSSNSGDLPMYRKDKQMRTPCNNEKCSQGTFRTVAELSTETEMRSSLPAIDMDKVLKGLVVREVHKTSCPSGVSHGKVVDFPLISKNSAYSDVYIPGAKIPLDLTLKTTIRLFSPSSVRWCQKLTSSFATICQSIPGFDWTCKGGHSVEMNPTVGVMHSKVLCSWLHPQTTLPPAVISAMSMQSAPGDSDFLVKRQQDWEDSFRCLYYMLRKRMCSLFYFFTQQFVAMFVSGNFGKTTHTCNAYISRSTRGLRSLLKENDISFSMPFCNSDVEQATAEDLVELSEIQKHNLGQTHRLDAMSNVDNSSQSLLAFNGNLRVHGLYDFLLNYRTFLNSSATDVPLLCSSIPFQNGSLNMPDVKCKVVRKLDTVQPSMLNHTENSLLGNCSAGISYLIEIKDAVIPPWTVSGVCAAMRSEQGSFEASFVTDPNSEGLNIAIDGSGLTDMGMSEDIRNGGGAFNIPEAFLSTCMKSASLKGLKYCDGTYRASLSNL